MRRHELRERVLQALYQIDVGRSEVEGAVQHVLEDDEASAADVEYVLRLVRGVVADQSAIDEMLEENVQGWKLDRIAKVDLSVLRLAVYELMHERDVDIATAVDEAVELAKSFSTDDSGKFVNGVLARVLPVIKEYRSSATT